jgi:hypothetical protein
MEDDRASESLRFEDTGPKRGRRSFRWGSWNALGWGLDGARSSHKLQGKALFIADTKEFHYFVRATFTTKDFHFPLLL